MKSSKCLFNKAVFKSDFRRFLPFAIPLLIIDLIIFPIIIYGAGFNLKDNPMDMESFAGFSVASDIFSFIFSGMFALLVFSYLYRPNRCNAIHAFPIGRRGLFITNFIAGYIMLVVPQVIAFSVAIPGIYFTSEVTGKIILLQFASIFAESFVFYSTGVLAVMLAGNIFAGAVIYLLLNFASGMIEGVINVVLSRISYGMGTMGIGGSFSFGKFSFSPISDFIACKVAEIFRASDVFESVYGDYDAGTTVFDTTMAYYPRLAVLSGVAVVFVILAYVFYKKRKLECAGDMPAFKIEIPIISVIVSFVGGSYFSLFICLFVPFKIIGFVVSFILFSFVSFIIAQMILHKSARVFNLKNIIIWAVTCVVAIVGLYSLSVYETNLVPKAEKVKEMSVSASYSMSITDKEDIKLAEKFHKALIEHEKNKKPKENANDEDFGILSKWLDSLFADSDYNVNIVYRLENDKVIIRMYGFDKEDEELVKMLYKLESKYHPESVFDDLEGIDFEITDMYAYSWNYVEDGNYEHSIEISKDKYKEAYNACRDYLKKYMEEYRTAAEDYDAFDIDNFTDGDGVTDGDGNYFFDNEDSEFQFYDITIKCRVTDEESLKKLEKLDEFNYDSSGASFEKDTYWDLDEWDTDGGEHADHDSGTFTITIREIRSNSELFKIISSYSAENSAI